VIGLFIVVSLADGVEFDAGTVEVADAAGEDVTGRAGGSVEKSGDSDAGRSIDLSSRLEAGLVSPARSGWAGFLVNMETPGGNSAVNYLFSVIMDALERQG
jgi:hypothetical protein